LRSPALASRILRDIEKSKKRKEILENSDTTKKKKNNLEVLDNIKKTNESKGE
jgi:hypothetical protein